MNKNFFFLLSCICTVICPSLVGSVESIMYPPYPLHNAARSGDVEQMRALLNSREFAIDAKDDGEMPLHIAAENGFTAIVQLLLDYGADVNVQSSIKMTPLHKAARNGHLETAKFLLELGAAVNQQDSEGMAPLHFAAIFGRLEMIQLLLQYGADINKQDRFGDTPLHSTIFWGGCAETVQFLLEHGASPFIGNIMGQFPIYYCGLANRLDLAALIKKYMVLPK